MQDLTIASILDPKVDRWGSRNRHGFTVAGFPATAYPH